MPGFPWRGAGFKIRGEELVAWSKPPFLQPIHKFLSSHQPGFERCEAMIRAVFHACSGIIIHSIYYY